MTNHSREPVGFTCSDIDDVKNTLEKAVKTLSDTEDELRQALRDMETLRESNAALRKWGTQEAMKVDQLEEQLESMESDRDGLQDELSECRTTIDELQLARSNLEAQISS